MSYKAESKDTAGEKSTDYYDDDSKHIIDPVNVEITSIRIHPLKGGVTDGFDLEIDFHLDRDVVAGQWIIKFLVDMTHQRLITVLGETPVEDYMEGSNDMSFSTSLVDISHIKPSTLANSALLMACLKVDGEEVMSVNIVANVTHGKSGELIREFLLPM